MPGKFRGKAGDGVEKYDGAGRLYPGGVRLKKIRSILLSPPGRRCGNLVFAVLVLAVFWYARNLRNAEIAAPAPETPPNILSTSPKYDRIAGFGGPVPARIVLDSASGKIDRIEFPPNAEDPEYWRQVLASGVFDRYRNLTPAEAAALPIDVVTGATFSSRAAQETIRERLAEAAALPPPVRPSIRWNWTDAAVILLLLGNLYCFFRPLRGRYRQIQLTANLFLLGFLAHGGLSLAQVAGWVRSSPHWTLSVPLLLFSAVILLALARGKNFYCSGVCPFGCAQELTAKLGRAVGVPQRLESFRFGSRLRRIVLGATVLALVCGIPFLPYEPFPAFAPGASWWMILSAFLLVALSLFRPRLWCRWFCSCGALLDFFCRTDLKPKPLDGGTKMNFERVVILALLLLLALALIRPGGAAASGGGTPVEPERRPDVLEVIHSRKSVRAYTKEPVMLPELETLVRAGFAAPTGANAQPWAFIIVTDRAKLDALAEVMPYGKMLKSAPGAVVVCGVSSQFRTGEAREMWVQDCSAATENILLAAEGTGLGAVWLGVFPYRERSAGVASVLGLPDDIIPFSIVSVGRPTGVEKPKDKYRPERIFLQQWGLPYPVK